jgi:hypothetical protein
MTKNANAIMDTQDSPGFVPTHSELIQLLKYWVREAIDDKYFIFAGQCFGSSDFRRIDSVWKRVNEIAQILGEEETDKAVKKAYEEAAQDFEQSDWILFRYGIRKEVSAYQDKGGQFLSDFERGEAEDIASRVVQRVFLKGTPEEQQALIKDELARYARKLHSYKRGWRHVVEIFGIDFPAELRRLIPSIGVDDPGAQPNEFVGTISIEQGKAFLAKLDEIAKKSEAALAALVTGHEER